MAAVLGVDVSTQSVTAEVRDLHSGELRGRAAGPLPPTLPPVSEHEPQWWWDSLVAVCGMLRRQGCDLQQVEAVSIASQCHGMVALDALESVIRPAKLWNDTTAVTEVAELLSWRPAEQWASSLGIIPNPAHTVAKLAWLKNQEPANFARTVAVALPHDWMNLKLTGTLTTDRSQASGSGYWSSLREEYDQEVWEWLWEGRAGQVQRPRVAGPTDTIGKLLPGPAAELGLRPGIAVAPGGGDQHLGAAGIGLQDGDVAFSLGTSGVVMAPTAAPVSDPAGWVDGVCNTWGGWLPLVCTLNATKVTDHFAYLLGVNVQELDALALAALPGPDAPPHIEGNALNLVAYLDGERSPSLPGALGLLAGLSGKTRREELALAAVMGVVFGLVRAQEALLGLIGGASGRTLVVGGGAKSAAYRQVLAETLGRAVTVVDAPEATARGACVQAAAVVRGEPLGVVRDKWAPAVVSVTQPRGIDMGPAYRRYLDLAGNLGALQG